MKPDFICIGAQKGGTTWLHRQVAHHPEFAMPPVKEIHYFDRHPQYPTTNRLNQTSLWSRMSEPRWVYQSLKTVFRAARKRNLSIAKWYWHFYFSNYTDDWYLSLFDFAGEKLTGDITPAYSILERADVERLCRVAGRPKIVFLIRNPIERDWSLWRYRREIRGEPFDLDNLSAIIAEIDSPGMELRSDYQRTIDLYRQVFGPQEVLIGFYDAIQQDPAGLLEAILKHIGAKDVSPNQKLLNRRFNVSQPVEMPEEIRRHLMQKHRPLIEYLTRRFGSYAHDWLDEINGNGSGKSLDHSLYAPVVYP